MARKDDGQEEGAVVASPRFSPSSAFVKRFLELAVEQANIDLVEKEQASMSPHYSAGLAPSFSLRFSDKMVHLTTLSSLFECVANMEDELKIKELPNGTGDVRILKASVTYSCGTGTIVMTLGGESEVAQLTLLCNECTHCTYVVGGYNGIWSTRNYKKCDRTVLWKCAGPYSIDHVSCNCREHPTSCEHCGATVCDACNCCDEGPGKFDLL